jgi:centriolar protein POC1
VKQTLDPEVVRTFRGHRDTITSLSFHPETKQLASGSLDATVMVWNFKPTLRAFRFVGHKGPVNSVSFSRDGALLASTSKDRTVRIWTDSVYVFFTISFLFNDHLFYGFLRQECSHLG